MSLWCAGDLNATGSPGFEISHLHNEIDQIARSIKAGSAARSDSVGSRLDVPAKPIGENSG